jgi:hypothetical protein
LSVACFHRPHNAMWPLYLKPDIISFRLLLPNLEHIQDGSIYFTINQVFI